MIEFNQTNRNTGDVVNVWPVDPLAILQKVDELMEAARCDDWRAAESARSEIKAAITARLSK